MEISTLDKLIKKFWKSEDNNQIYRNGVCSEVSVALKKFLNAGTISKAGLMHTYLDYNGHCVDIRGCFTKSQYPIMTPATYYRPASIGEVNHIHKLLERDTVLHIVKGLKRMQKKARHV